MAPPAREVLLESSSFLTVEMTLDLVTTLGLCPLTRNLYQRPTHMLHIYRWGNIFVVVTCILYTEYEKTFCTLNTWKRYKPCTCSHIVCHGRVIPLKYPNVSIPQSTPNIPHCTPKYNTSSWSWGDGVGVWEGLKYDHRILEQPLKQRRDQWKKCESVCQFRYTNKWPILTKNREPI